jgi:hypothetical protein
MRLGAATAVVGSILVSSASVLAAEKGTVTFIVRDDRGNDLDAKVTLDEDANAIPLGRQQTLEPGIHDVHWSHASGAHGTQKLTVIEGQHGRIFQIIANTPPAAAPAIVASPIVTTSAPAVLAPPPNDSAGTKREGGGPWPYILLAGGGTLAVASAVFQLVAINEDSDARHYAWASTRDDLGPVTRAALDDSSNSHYDAAKTNETIAITCGILAVTAVSVGVTWLIVGHK